MHEVFGAKVWVLKGRMRKETAVRKDNKEG
jgi:hypothetical protein